MARPTLKYKFCLLPIYVITYAVFYLIPNFWPVQTAFSLPLLAIDRMVPFLPWTFLIYLSDYVLVVLTIGMLTEMDKFHSFVRLIFGVLVVCGLFFLFFPTTYPRPVYPEASGLIALAMKIVGTMDTPNNCFPSHHVAATVVAAWALRYKGPKIIAIWSVWALLIFASTMTTKQHYFMDIVGGLCSAILVAFLELLYVRRRGSSSNIRA